MAAAADIVMFLHRSEGFGLVAAEGMLLGKPVVATDWSAILEFMDESCAALVRSELVAVEDPRGVYAVRDAVWTDVRHAADWLRRLADDPVLRRSLGEAGRRLGTGSLAEALHDQGVPTGQ